MIDFRFGYTGPTPNEVVSLFAGLAGITKEEAIKQIREGLVHATDADPLYIRGPRGTVDTDAVYARTLLPYLG